MANDYDPASPTPEIDGNACKEILHDKENFMKPEKVKSRWRRNSEMETQDSNPIGPANDNSTCILDDKDIKSKIFQTFQNLEENLYLFERKKTKRRKEVRRMLCECTLGDADVGCGDECLNRTLLIECGSRCPTGDACSNRRFQKRQYVKTEPFAAEKKGYGLKVLEDVPRGTFVIEYVGEVLNSSLFKKRVKEYSREKESHYYFMALSSDAIIDARVKGNLSRFINHSCDPNCETQKWTVNGDLRVGFFAKRDIKADEELTFDYQLQRYGRQAQKCYCQSENCKGYIGVSGDEITLDIDTSKKEREKNKKKRLDKEEKEKEVLEEVMGKEEIEKLLNGLRSKEHTLILARLMVRAEDVVSREKLLDIILSTTEVACLRLFLDYHGLAILMCWMADVRNDSLKSKILEVLSILPVPNKNMLIDSKIFSFVQKWAYPKKERDKINNLEDTFCENASDKDNFLSKKVKSCDTSDSETDGTTILDGSKSDSLSDCDLMSKNVSINSNPTIYLSPPDEEHSSDNKTSDNNTHSDEDSPSDDNKTESAEIESLAKNLLSSWKDLKEEFRIPRLIDKKEDSGISDKYGEKIENAKLSTDNTAKSISPTMEKPQEIKVVCPNFSRKYSHSSSRLSKDEKRSLYPVKMHHNRKNLPKNMHYSSHHNDYKSSHSDSYEYQNMCAGRVGEKNLSYPYKSRTLLPTPGTSSICTLPSVPPAAEPIPSVYPHNNVLYPVPNPNPNFQMPPPATYLSQPPPAVTPDHAASSVYAINTQPHLINLGVNSPVVPMQVIPTDPVYSKEPQYTNNEFYDKKPIYISPPQLHAFPVPQQPEQIYPLAQENGEQKSKQVPLKLPPNWKTATDDSGNVYFYHAIKRESRWDPPTPEPADTDNGTPTYDEPKTTERTNKHEKSHSRRSHQKHSKRKTTTAPADTSSSKVPVNNDIAKKIKELFRTKMSSFVVQCLNPYRKEDCRVAKITSNEDFKHLARKLTHFVMAKELKHCKIIEELDANQSVKLKARDFIHKYMARYGPIYRKEKCDSIADD